MKQIVKLPFRSLWMSLLFISFFFLGMHFLSVESLWSFSVKNRPWYSFIKKSKLQFTLPRIHKLTLKNGIPVYYISEKSVPLTELVVYIDGGGFEVSPEKTGLQGLWGESVVYSGSKTFPRDKLSAYLDERASKINYSPGLQRSAFELSSLSHFFSADLNVLFDVMQNPQFAKEDFDFIRKQILTEISKREESPGKMASVAGQFYTYRGTVRGHLPYTRTVSPLQVSDTEEWQKKMFRAERMTIAISGNFDIKKTEEQLNALFGTLPFNAGDKPNMANLAQKPQMPQGKILHYKKEIPQSTILWRAPGMAHNNPDYYALRLYDFILGGDSFNSELTQTIRTRNGWAYSVYSTFNTDAFMGSVSIVTQTANANVKNVYSEIAKILEHPDKFVTEEKLELAKISLENKFVFLFESPSQYLSQHLSLLWDGLPETYLSEIPANIRKVTREQVLRVAKKYYAPKSFFSILVGPDQNYKAEQFSNFSGGIESISVEK